MGVPIDHIATNTAIPTTSAITIHIPKKSSKLIPATENTANPISLVTTTNESKIERTILFNRLLDNQRPWLATNCLNPATETS